MKAAIIRFPGTNRERDIARALERLAGARATLVWHGETALPAADLIVLPGGFSYGDYLRAGAIAAHAPILPAVKAAADKGVPVLGICNGFQMLTEAGLLPGALMRNAGLNFICKTVYLRVETTDSVFTQGFAKAAHFACPVAHHDGNYFADEATLDRLEAEDRIAFRYVDAQGARAEGANPNGAQRDIAGILNAKRNVLGMMPHPENRIEPGFGGADAEKLFAGLAMVAA